MTRIITDSETGRGWYGDDSASAIAAALDDCGGQWERGRALIVEPRSAHFGAALRAAGFFGELIALASAPIGALYDIAADYTRVIVDDWAGRLRARRQQWGPGDSLAALLSASSAIEAELGTFQTIIVTDLTRYLPTDETPAALRWLARLLDVRGLLALAEPALSRTLGVAGLLMAAPVRAVPGDWPRTLTLWHRQAGAGRARVTPLLASAALPAPAPPTTTRATPGLRVVEAPAGVPAPSPFQSAAALASAGRLDVTLRAGSGLVVVVAAHGALTPAERQAISRYRLEQYALAGLYSSELVMLLGIADDPSMALLNADDTHVIAATSDGLIAAYMCLQTASSAIAPRSPGALGMRVDVRHLHLGALPLAEALRPLFPVETEYGALFARHPGLRTLPVSGVREITRLVRNQRPDLRARLRDIADLAVAETIVAAALHVIEPVRRIEAIIGCIAPEARQAMANYRVQVAYAPEAPIVGENLGGGAAGGPLIWADAAREAGRFWPFAISTADVRHQRAYYMALADALDAPSPQTAREALNALRRRTPLGAPRFAAPSADSGRGREGAPPVAWVGLNTRSQRV